MFKYQLTFLTQPTKRLFVVGFLLCISTFQSLYAANVTPIPLGNLQRFNELKLRDVLANERRIETPVSLLVPTDQMDCFNEIVSVMPALSINAQGELFTKADGSKEQSFREGFFSLSPAGVFHIATQCEIIRTKNKVFTLTTNAPDEQMLTPALLNWLSEVNAKDYTIVRISPNGSKLPITAADLNAASKNAGFITAESEEVRMLSRLWNCRSYGPGVKPQDFDMFFNSKGDFVIKNQKERLQGTYLQNEKRIDIALQATATRPPHEWNVIVMNWNLLTEQKFDTRVWDKRMKSNFMLNCVANKAYLQQSK